MIETSGSWVKFSKVVMKRSSTAGLVYKLAMV